MQVTSQGGRPGESEDVAILAQATSSLSPNPAMAWWGWKRGATAPPLQRRTKWHAYLDELVRKHPGNHGLDLDSISAEAVFVPVLFLFGEDSAGSIPAPEAVEVPSLTGPAKLLPIEGMADSALIPLGDSIRLLGEDDRTL